VPDRVGAEDHPGRELDQPAGPNRGGELLVAGAEFREAIGRRCLERRIDQLGFDCPYGVGCGGRQHVRSSFAVDEAVADLEAG